VAGEKVALAMELAANRRLPLILLCAAGGARTSAGLLALAQLPKLAAAAARLHRAGVPVVAVLAHATTGGVYAGLANQADVVLAEPGAQIGLGGRAGRGDRRRRRRNEPAEAVLAHGLLDGVVDRVRLRPTLATLLGLFADRGAFRPDSPPSMAGGGVGSPAPPPAAPEVEAARHPPRPAPTHYLRRVVGDLVELRGDRLRADDPALACGLGRLGGVPVAAFACGPGRIGAAGYRKATRVMRLAGHLELPLVLLIDTPGAAFGAAAEADGIGVAVGHLLGLTSFLPVPVVTAITGEAGGIGGIALAAGDRMLMLEHAVYRVADGEGESPAGGLPFEQRGGAGASPARHRAPSAPSAPASAAAWAWLIWSCPSQNRPPHANPDAAARALGLALAGALAELAGVGPRRLLDDRARRLRGLGQATPEGREAARREVREFQDVQRALARSLGDLRERWEGRWVGRHPVRELRARLHLAAIARREGAAVREPGTGPAESAPLLGGSAPTWPISPAASPAAAPALPAPRGDDRDGHEGPRMILAAPPPPFLAAAVQFEPTPSAKEANIAALLRLTEQAAAAGARLIVLPEMATTGYCWVSREEVASEVEPVPGPTTARFGELARGSASTSWSAWPRSRPPLASSTTARS
jgi:acetyl-CoA carboxylase carboxyl transferase subunit beta